MDNDDQLNIDEESKLLGKLDDELTSLETVTSNFSRNSQTKLDNFVSSISSQEQELDDLVKEISSFEKDNQDEIDSLALYSLGAE